MQVREITTENPACCSPQTSLQDVAKMMADNDCGEIPVLDEQRRPTGVVTDRDITCRAVAQGKDPKQTAVREVMSNSVVTTTPETSVEDCCATMEEKSQADIARAAPEHETTEVVREISRPTRNPRA